LIDGNYKTGKLAFVKIFIEDLNDKKEIVDKGSNCYNQYSISLGEPWLENFFEGRAIFCVQQISPQCFIISVIDKNFKLLDRSRHVIKDIPNPSCSIN